MVEDTLLAPLRGVLYLSRDKRSRGLKSVAQDYKLIRIKVATKLYENLDPMMRSVRTFEEKAYERGFSSLVKDAEEFAEELGLDWI